MKNVYTINELLGALPAMGLLQDDVLTGPPRKFLGIPYWPGPEVAVVARHMPSGARYRLDRDGSVWYLRPDGFVLRADQFEPLLEDAVRRLQPANDRYDPGWPGHW